MTGDERLVCFYTPSHIGGHARYSYELISAIARDTKGFVPVLVTSRNLVDNFRNGPYLIHDILRPIRSRGEFTNVLSWLYSRLTHYWLRERRFLQWVSGNRDVWAIHFQEYTPWLAPWHFIKLKQMGKRLFYTVHNVTPHVYPLGIIKALYDRLSRTSWRRCDALFVHSEKLREDLSEFLGPGHPPIYISAHGVWAGNDSLDSELSSEHIERRLGTKRILFFGVLRRNKGLEILLKAMSSLKGFELVVAGVPEDQKYAQAIRELVSTYGSSGNIELIDRFIDESEIPRLYSDATIAALPYTSFSAQSGVLHLALTYRLPVVVTDVGALGETVRQWGIGRVVAEPNSDELAREIRSAMEPTAYEQMVDSIGVVNQSLSWSTTAKSIVDAYNDFV